MEEHHTFIMLGTNTGDKRVHLERALNSISIEVGRIIKLSAVYESEPWGNSNQPWYLNQVVEVGTRLEPDELLDQLLEIEHGMGRVRVVLNGPRIIDLDVLLYDDRVMDSQKLVLPHPRMHQRRFNLEPMVEIAPLLDHPVLNKTMSDLLLICEDPLAVRKI